MAMVVIISAVNDIAIDIVFRLVFVHGFHLLISG